MVAGVEMSQGLQWKIDMPNGTSKVLEPQRGLIERLWKKLLGSVVMNIWNFLVNCWKIGEAEPTKFIHCLKVGIALSAVSLFYYMRPLYDGVGGNAMWAVMTVVVVSEYTVGSTIYKSLNRIVATTVGGSLGVGIHWVAAHCDKRYEPIVLGVSVFIFASLATFTRFIPKVKARFDYGAMIFILTFSLVTISGYRVEELVMMAQNRVSTVAIGISLCIIISILLWPVWAGDNLHNQTIGNLEKLADSLEGYVAEYFSNEESSKNPDDNLNKKLQGYKCALNSKASEESMANFAIWEPAHGQFYFGYPWKQYLKIGAAVRSSAYCIDNLNSCIDSKIQAPDLLKNHIKDRCIRLSSCCSGILKVLAKAIKTRKRLLDIDSLVHKMVFEAEDFQNSLKTLPFEMIIPLATVENSTERNAEKTENPTEGFILEVMPLGMFTTLMIEIVERIEEIVSEVDKLAKMAKFKIEEEKKLQGIQTSENDQTTTLNQQTMKTSEENKTLNQRLELLKGKKYLIPSPISWNII